MYKYLELVIVRGAADTYKNVYGLSDRTSDL